MFSALQNKFKKFIIIIIMLLITIPFIALSLSFQMTIKQNYTENSQKFHHQMAQTLNLKLSQIEDSVNLYVFKYHLANVLIGSPNHSFSHNDLNNLPNYCPDASCAFVFDTAGNIKYCNKGNLLRDFERLFSDDSYHPYFFSEKPVWFSIEFTAQNNCYWIYTMPIYNEQKIPVGHISILIEDQKFNNFFNNLNTDYCQNDLFYLYSDRSRNLLLKNIQAAAKLDSSAELWSAIQSSSQVKYKKASISVFQLSSDSLKLVSISKKDHINNILRNFFLLLLGIWFVLLLICIYASTKITNQFIFDLQRLHKKINTYIKSKKFNKQREVIS